MQKKLVPRHKFHEFPREGRFLAELQKLSTGLDIIPRFCRFCPCLEGGISSKTKMETMAFWEYCFSEYSLFAALPPAGSQTMTF